ADAIATELLETILNDMDFAGEVAVMVNGMGSTPEMELFIVNKTVQAILLEKNIHPHQTIVGEYMTALEMTGCSITVLKLDEELKKLLDAPSSAPAFRKQRGGEMYMELTIQDVKNWMLQTNEKIKENKDYLTTLDQAI